MSEIVVNGSGIGTAFGQLLTTNDVIEPGSAPGYQLCKLIFTFHPLGMKLADKPIKLAQSQRREISVNNSPEELVVEAFNNEWDKIKADRLIMRTMRLSRVYGIAAIAALVKDEKNSEPLDFQKIYKQQLSFNVYDPLNTAGSLVLNQDPLAMDFQHTTEIVVNGSVFHQSRSCVMMNEDPMYIEWSPSAFGFSGRSVYQRGLFPLKTYIRTMIADDMIETKVGILVAMIKQAGSIVTNPMMKLFASKRAILKEAQTGNVLSIGDTDKIESLDLKNMEGPHALARKHVMENIASAAGMPAKMITEETLAEGFGEGTEDAKAIATYIDGVREDMQPIYDYFDKIVRHRAWNPEFYETIQNQFEEYKGIDYNTAFYRWTNDFRAKWPSLLKEPDSELVKVDEVKLTALVAAVQTLLPFLDPENQAIVIEAFWDNINAMKFLFDDPFELDYTLLRDFLEEKQVQGDLLAMSSMDKQEDQDESKDPTDAPKTPKQEIKGAAADAAIINFRSKVADFVRDRQARKRRGAK